MSIGSILEKSTYLNFEIIGVSNNSEEERTFEAMERLSGLDGRVKFFEHNIPFNYSEINNYAVSELAGGEHVILLNNDIEIISEEWIEAMLEFSQREDVGAVGAKLYYPDERIQHAGVILGLGGVAGHSHKYFPRHDRGYFFRPHIVQNLSAVTAACMMVKRRVYLEAGGMDEENLKVAFNDVDFCLRLREMGYLNVYTPYCEAYHHESLSRGKEDDPQKAERFRKEIEYMKMRHAGVLRRGDPYYNVNLTLDREDFSYGRIV
jgi:GT2 family glycosyltransferase